MALLKLNFSARTISLQVTDAPNTGGVQQHPPPPPPRPAEVGLTGSDESDDSMIEVQVPQQRQRRNAIVPDENGRIPGLPARLTKPRPAVVDLTGSDESDAGEVQVPQQRQRRNAIFPDENGRIPGLPASLDGSHVLGGAARNERHRAVVRPTLVTTTGSTETPPANPPHWDISNPGLAHVLDPVLRAHRNQRAQTLAYPPQTAAQDTGAQSWPMASMTDINTTYVHSPGASTSQQGQPPPQAHTAPAPHAPNPPQAATVASTTAPSRSAAPNIARPQAANPTDEAASPPPETHHGGLAHRPHGSEATSFYYYSPLSGNFVAYDAADKPYEEGQKAKKAP